MTPILLSLWACRSPSSTDSLQDTAPPEDTACDSAALYPDDDGDGWGAGQPVEVCVDTVGYSAQAGDCDDADDSVHPGAPDLPLDGVDQDCDGADNRDGDGDGDPVDTDCDDSDPERSSVAFELCDTGVDEDCDGVVDEDCQYFGGVASGVADRRIDGVWIDDWSNRSHAGAGVWGLPDLDGDGQPDIAIAGKTYDTRFLHFVSGQAVVDHTTLDLDDAFMAIREDDLPRAPSEVAGVYTYSYEDSEYLVVQAQYCYLLPTDNLSSVDFVRSSDQSCHQRLLEHPLPTLFQHTPQSLSLHTYVDASGGVNWSTLALDDTEANWSVADDWNGDDVNELFIGSYATEDYTQFLWHADGPFEIDTEYPNEYLTEHGSTAYGDTGHFFGVVNRPDLAGYIDGDGLQDLLVEAYGSGSSRELVVWTDTTNADLSAPDIHVVNSGDNQRPSTNLGTFFVGDINCDGTTDLVQTFIQDGEYSGLALELGPLETGTYEIQSDPDGLLYRSGFELDNAYAAQAAFVDDLNGDGCQELLVGDPSYAPEPDRFGPGTAYLFFGAPGAP